MGFEESEGVDSLVGVGDKDKDLERRSLSTECSSQTPSWFNVSRSLMQQLLGHGAATRHGSLPGGEVGKQLFVSRPTYLSSSPVRHPVLCIAGIRFKGTKTPKKGPKKKKAKEVRMKLKRIRMERKARKAAMSPEETLEYRIAKVQFFLHLLACNSYESCKLTHPCASGSVDVVRI
jgi:hypothetical protein